MATTTKRLPLTPTTLITACAVLICGWSLNSGAANLNLSTVPLYMGTNAAPNIMLIIDDSGSMDWEVITKDMNQDARFTGTQPDGSSPAGSGSVKHRDNDDDGKADCGFTSGTFYGYTYGVTSPYNSYSGGSNQCNTADDQEWRFRNYQFNTLYFNPNRTYKPWAGVDNAGVPFGNMPITAARLDPYLSSSVTIDLTRHSSNYNSGYKTADRDKDGQPDGFRYYTWTDTNGNGRFDNGEETQFLIKNADAATKQNFANWFSYYRSRELVAKAAYGMVIADTRNVRIGLSTLNNNNNVKRAITLMNDDPKTGNKRILLDALYSVDSSSGTPLQTALDECGKYLSCSSNALFSSCPALTASQGGNCQQNFAIMMTDGFYNGTAPKVGNTDGDNDTAFDGGAYADKFKDTLADIAMKYYENDIQPGLANDLAIVPGVDEATHQHMVTYSVSFGMQGTVAEMPTNKTAPFNWPNPTAGDAEKIDDLRHAAFNGRGMYLSANDPDALVAALQTMMQSITASLSSAAEIAMSSTNLAKGATLYQARFETMSWSGELRYMPISSSGEVGETTLDAGKVLTAANPNTRVILTRHATTGAGIPFRWASLSSAQQAQLNANSGGSNDGKGSQRLDWLRGVRTGEASNGGIFRDRVSVLGDIIYSAPAYVGGPVFNYSFDNYAAFRIANTNRTPMVYVGANDGMLHGFDAVTGQERLAFVPATVYSRLGRLTDTNYTHRYYVDGSPTVGDVFIGGAWRTMLVGSLRGGGQGIFALDVTNPATMSESNAASIVKWQFSDAQDVDMGYSYSQPVITRLRDGRWVAIFGNGYNNTESDGAVSTTGAAVLYIVNMADGSLIRKLSTGAGMSVDPTGTSRPNGLATPAPVDVDGDSMVDYVYAGDLFGNLWRFDLNNTNPASWAVSNGGQALFTARSSGASPKAQAITARPVVGAHPTVANSYMVYFGTGKYFEVGDNAVSGQVTQSLYGIWDRNLSGAGASTVSRSSLLQQTVTDEIFMGGRDARVTSSNPINWSTHRGWYLDLINPAFNDNKGERQVSEAILRDGRLIFTTILPNPQICGMGGGSWLIMLNAEDGAGIRSVSFDTNGDGVINSDDQVTTTNGGAQGTTVCTTTSERQNSSNATAVIMINTQTCTTTYSNGAKKTTVTQCKTKTNGGNPSGSTKCDAPTTTTTGTIPTSTTPVTTTVTGAGGLSLGHITTKLTVSLCDGKICLGGSQGPGNYVIEKADTNGTPLGRITWQHMR